MEKYGIFYNDDDTNLNHNAIEDFQKKWFLFDKSAKVCCLHDDVYARLFSFQKGYISFSKVKLLLRSLNMQKYYTYDNKSGVSWALFRMVGC